MSGVGSGSAGEVVLEHELLRVVCAPARGAEIRFVGAPGGENVLACYDWRAPLPAAESVTYGSHDLDWISQYRGGWQELFPNSGDGCEVDGVPLPFHGELSYAAWEVVERDAVSVVLRAAARLPLVVERRMRLVQGAATLLIEETASNEGTAEAPFLWGQHPAFAALPGMRVDVAPGPLHADGAGDAAAAAEHWPQGGHPEWGVAPEATATRESLHYLPDRPGWAALRHVDSGRGVALAWDRATFPHVWLWQEMGGAGLPWYGRARILAVEPQTAWPRDGLAAAIERGQAHRLAPGASHETWTTLSLFAATASPVTGVERDGTVRVGG